MSTADARARHALTVLYWSLTCVRTYVCLILAKQGEPLEERNPGNYGVRARMLATSAPPTFLSEPDWSAGGEVEFRRVSVNAGTK